MPLTPDLSLPYLTWTDAPDHPANNQALAEAVESILSERIQHGSETVVGTGTNSADLVVTFSPAFTATPKVFANYLTSTAGAKDYHASVISVSTTQATLRILRKNAGNTFSDPRRLCWLAVGI